MWILEQERHISKVNDLMAVGISPPTTEASRRQTPKSWLMQLQSMLGMVVPPNLVNNKSLALCKVSNAESQFSFPDYTTIPSVDDL